MLQASFCMNLREYYDTKKELPNATTQSIKRSIQYIQLYSRLNSEWFQIATAFWRGREGGCTGKQTPTKLHLDFCNKIWHNLSEYNIIRWN